MFRMLLRFIGLCLLASAFVSLILDTTRSLSSGTLVVTSLGDSLLALPSSQFALARDFIERHTPSLIWDPVLMDLLKLPAWLAFGLLGGLTIWLGGKPAPKFGFSSR